MLCMRIIEFIGFFCQEINCETLPAKMVVKKKFYSIFLPRYPD